MHTMLINLLKIIFVVLCVAVPITYLPMDVKYCEDKTAKPLNTDQAVFM